MICCWAQHLAEAVILQRLGPHDGLQRGADGAITHWPAPPPHRLTPVPTERGHQAAPPTGRREGSAGELSFGLAPPCVGHSFKFQLMISPIKLLKFSQVLPHTLSSFVCVCNEGQTQARPLHRNRYFLRT